MTGRGNSVARGAMEWALAFAIAIAAILFLKTFVVEAYRVPTESMEPTIDAGDMLIGQKVTIELGQAPQPGDIVVFSNPDESSDHDILVKRVIAVGGQTVDLEDGRVVVDGEELDEPYASGDSYPLLAQAPGTSVSFPLEVPEGSVWVMGDNRENSSDSRYFGPVSQDDLISVIMVRYWPLSRLGAVS